MVQACHEFSPGEIKVTQRQKWKDPFVCARNSYILDGFECEQVGSKLMIIKKLHCRMSECP
jgi:hypothetical protein